MVFIPWLSYKPREKMIEVYYKNRNIKKYESINEIEYLPNEIFSIRFIDFINSDLEAISKKFELDLSSFSKREDIEISSHYIESAQNPYNNYSMHFIAYIDCRHIWNEF
jgi:magnesium transporter